MLFRFSLYGFLKNQRYFEPFLVLAFREKGLSFFQIGLLIGVRELCINLMEVPTGAVADVAGRRKAMVYSHVAYAASFVLLGMASALPLLFLAMFLFGVGEAFRTGTHKAIIFDWLRQQGRGQERTLIYGFTRSWSKIGSAVSVLVAAAIVISTRQYSAIFWISAVPACLNIVNFLTYPASLDGTQEERRGAGPVWRTMVDGLRQCAGKRELRRPLIESMGFEGVYRVSKDYLQPILRQAALSLPVLLAVAPQRRTALLVGIVYALLHVLSSVASRKADAVRKLAGDEEQGTRCLWIAYALTFVLVMAGTATRCIILAVIGFIVLAILQNLWRPIMIGRIAGQSGEKTLATVLSVESQAKALFAAALAPLLGLAVDAMPGQWRFVPVAAIGLLVASASLLTRRAGHGMLCGINEEGS